MTFAAALLLQTGNSFPGTAAAAQEDVPGVYQVMVSSMVYGTHVKVEYPVLNGVEGYDQNVVDTINTYFYEEARKVIEEQGPETDSVILDLQNAGSNMAEYVSYEVTCDSIYLNGNVLSVSQMYYMNMGGAHPYHFMAGTSFDLATGEKMSMGDLLGCDEVTAKEAVVAAYKETIIGQVENISEESIRNSFDEMAYWMEEDGMHVNLAQYAVASYAAGPQHVVVTGDTVSRVSGTSGASPGTEIPLTAGGTSSSDGGSQSSGSSGASGETITVINGIQAPSSDFIFPFSSSRLLTSDDLRKLEGASVEEEHYKSQLAINEILARYGYTFHAEQGGAAKEAYDKFEGLSWYESAKPYCPSGSANDMLYTYISSTELKNVDIICEWQKQHNCYY